jgi:ABC-type lipoprotein release transport system permease subunit
MNLLAFILHRSKRHWQVLVPLILGVIIATSLLASGPMLVDTIMDFAMAYKLRNADPLDGNIRLTTYIASDVAVYQDVDKQVRNLVNDELGPYVNQVISSVGSNWTFPWLNGQIVTDQRVNLSFYEGIQDQVELTAGKWPSVQPPTNGVVPAAISEAMASAYTLQVGDRLPISLKNSENTPSLWIQVEAIIRPKNPRLPYWFGEFSPLRPQSDQNWTAQYSVIIPARSSFGTSKTIFPASHIKLVWNVLISPQSIHPQDVSLIQTRLKAINSDVNVLPNKILVETNLDQVLSKFNLTSEVVRVPLYLLIVEVLLLALYYIAMVSALAIKQVEGEFSTLSSRGASITNLFNIQIIEALIIAGVALVSGPGLAVLMVWLLAKIGPLADVRQADWVLRLSWAPWVAAGLGASASTLGLLFPIRPAINRSVVVHQRATSRKEQKPWWQRYYLDVFVLLGGLVLLWRVNLHGGMVAENASQVRLDWLLLLAPLALLFGSATILLRVFPLIMRLLSWVIARGRDLPATLAIYQISRDPTHVARLVLLLTLSMALGILTTGLNATLDLSDSERATYASGSDLRLVFDTFTPISEVQATPEVTAASTVWRGSGSVNVRAYRAFPSFDLLAIDPFTFSAVTHFRDDFADNPMKLNLGYLVTTPDQFPVTLMPLPGQTTGFGLWVANTSPATDTEANPLDYLVIQSKFSTAQDETLTFNMIPAIANLSGKESVFLPQVSAQMPNSGISQPGEAPSTMEWRYFQVTLPTLPPESYPINLHSLWFKVKPFRSGRRSMGIYSFALDDFGVIENRDQPIQVIEDFETPTRIWQTNNTRSLARYTETVPAHSGNGSLWLNLPSSTSQSVSLSLAGKTSREPLPALSSQNFLNSTGLHIGDRFIGQVSGIQIPMVIKDTLHYFPTLYEEEDQGFLVTALDPFLALLNRESINPINFNEVWASTNSQPAAAALAESFPNTVKIYETDSVRRAIKSDPLSLGLRTVTFLAYLITAGLSLVGFATYFYMSARQREANYGILRSLGLSPQQLYTSLLLEQFILIIFGLALGTILGALLNRLILPGLPISLGDHPPVPPFIPQEDWWAALRIYLFLLTTFVVSIGIATIMLWRSHLHRVLRVGQE